MIMLPIKAVLQDADPKFKSVRQTTQAWCIAAGIEVLLRYFNITTVSQEDMVREYCREFGDEALCQLKNNNWVPLPITGLPEDKVLQLARGAAFRSGNFETMLSALSRCVSLADLGFEAFHPTDSSHFLSTLKNAIASGHGFLMPCLTPTRDFHVYAVSAYDGDAVTAYEPGSGTFSTKTPAEFHANNDCLVIRPTARNA